MQCSGLTTSSSNLWRVTSLNVPGTVVSLFKWAYLDFQLDFWSSSRVPNMSRRVRLNRYVVPFPAGWYGVDLDIVIPNSEQSSLMSLPSKCAP